MLRYDFFLHLKHIMMRQMKIRVSKKQIAVQINFAFRSSTANQIFHSFHMRRIIDRATSRGLSRSSWLTSFHTFSFNEYFNLERAGWGALKAINDDTVKPSSGFGMHPHKNMEIVSIPLAGELTHQDSQGNSKTIRYGEIQTMSAGTGIIHNEMNNSVTDGLQFLQIWIQPKKNGLNPEYHYHKLYKILEQNKLKLIVSPNDEAPATLNQNAWISLGDFDEGFGDDYELHGKDQGVYIFVIDGDIQANEESLHLRDGLGLAGLNKVVIKANKPSRVLLIEIPMLEI